jgi:hypothetical protein
MREKPGSFVCLETVETYTHLNVAGIFGVLQKRDNTAKLRCGTIGLRCSVNTPNLCALGAEERYETEIVIVPTIADVETGPIVTEQFGN